MFKHGKFPKHGYGRFMAIALVGLLLPAVAAAASAPPNSPAKVKIAGDSVRLVYDGNVIFEGSATHGGASFETRTEVFSSDDKIEQVVYFFGGDSESPLVLTGKIHGGPEAFPCEVDRPDRRGGGPPIVRHVSGLSRSLLNRAVYDRRGDWVVSVDPGARATVRPAEAGAGQQSFDLEAEGAEIVLRFRPRYYTKHRGLAFFEPWATTPWKDSVAGWISWFAFYDRVTEQDIVETAAAFAEALKSFGYDYFQIDDGYQQIQGAPEKWLNPNAKFPKGLPFLVDTIRKRGLRPGIWTAASVLDFPPVKDHPEWFVRDGKGLPAKGNWIGWILDGSNPEALDRMVKPLYRGLIGQGWQYFKLDALRHLRYEGYNANRDYFKKKRVDPVSAFRRYVQAVRDTIGRDRFLLACWGLRPELAGLVDGCRIGDDGFSYAGLAQFNSYNNVVWRNDPDHIELDADGYRSTLVTTLTGSLMMLTDKPAVYRTEAIEPAKRTAPVLFTRPGQIYDVDPSRSALIAGADTAVSGSGPRPFDAGYTPVCFLYSLEIDRPFENWIALGRTGGDFGEIRMADLGLDPAGEYYVFEFWSKTLRGSFQGTFVPGPLDPRYRSQAFIIRERKPGPQLIATNRHVTGGGPDLENVHWDGGILSGKSRAVPGDPYILYLTEPAGYQFDKAEATGAKVVKIDRDGGLVRIMLSADGDGAISWKATYVRT